MWMHVIYVFLSSVVQPDTTEHQSKEKADDLYHFTLYLSTKIPAWTAWTMLRNRGFSSFRLSIRPICRVKVEASQSRTSDGTDSDWMSLSSSSVSTKRLRKEKKGQDRFIRCYNMHRSSQLRSLGGQMRSQSCPSNDITCYVIEMHYSNTIVLYNSAQLPLLCWHAQGIR